MMSNFSDSNDINPTAYTPLLQTIAKGESGGNYNAHFGNPANSAVQFTDMTMADVFRWQEQHVQNGNVSNAVGKYQIIKPTLLELVDKLGVQDEEKFDEELQDRLAIALLERRGSKRYVNGELSREDFAASLAKEWAALPRVVGSNPQDSYYASDGINASRIAVDEVLGALDTLQKNAKNSE